MEKQGQESAVIWPLGKLPQSVRFAISGGLGNIAFFYLDQAVLALNPFLWQKSTGTDNLPTLNLSAAHV
jgi:hypothetical protein